MVNFPFFFKHEADKAITRLENVAEKKSKLNNTRNRNTKVFPKSWITVISTFANSPDKIDKEQVK